MPLAARRRQFFPERCIYCGACLEECPQGAHTVAGTRHEFRRELCDGCGLCIDSCFAKGLVLVGRRTRVDEVMDEVLQDRAFYMAQSKYRSLGLQYQAAGLTPPPKGKMAELAEAAARFNLTVRVG